ncbi:C-GCAxxG-C-C family protein [Acetivibrio ethanolgignens]|uniref:C_GCAxxG_C_C family protein n=1 Tax=Acetivibrio ethanolgignens TaxID=290052 RepID=A0A0V8QB86_9FIRM|nr:C-GCAxxG-C-C family protein [Acetivibrio ethanolgignens]KSV57799.1 hypothetical protein ASU35_14975 [Acetivibrio ethanolgignens]
MKPEVIAEKFSKGFDCSQVVLEYFAKELNISSELANKVSACFGGGMAKGKTCGAVVGALMVIGLKYGQYEEEHMEQKDIMSAKRAEFFEKLAQKYPSDLCADLLGHDISKPGELERVLEEGLLFSFCPVLVSDVIEILIGI